MSSLESKDILFSFPISKNKFLLFFGKKSERKDLLFNPISDYIELSSLVVIGINQSIFSKNQGEDSLIQTIPIW